MPYPARTLTQCHAPAQNMDASTESLVVEGPNNDRMRMTTADDLHTAHFNPVTATIRANNSGAATNRSAQNTLERLR
ncbi:hypothetical protein JMJ35_007419 [Cladonia borealis]|uniref:Uncharacterized protein n=1 Tax=Cladonia borealis TaxID=184061 RepID=A0AA39QVP0_9LECA|nr:hypothetical protein JMJ35_007419 [Cladonia borealis]